MLDILKATKVDCINELLVKIRHDQKTYDLVSIFERNMLNKAFLTDDLNKVHRFVRTSANELVSFDDIQLLNKFEKGYQVVSSNDALLGSLNDEKSIVKINHGFWEIFSNLVIADNYRSKLRKRNQKAVQERFFYSGSMYAALAAMIVNEDQQGFFLMRSMTSGRAETNDLLLKLKGVNEADEIRRGVLLSSIIYERLLIKDEEKKIVYNDSFYFNKSYQDGQFLKSLLKLVGKNDGIGLLFLTPNHLKGLRIKLGAVDSKVVQYRLAVSSNQINQLWREHLQVLSIVLDSLLLTHDKMIILFQGSILSPIIAQFLNDNYRSRVSIIDFGRLLDVEVLDEGLQLTGSPFPNGKIHPTGFFDNQEMIDSVFQRIRG